MKAKEYVQQHLGETAEQSVAKLTAALERRVQGQSPGHRRTERAEPAGGFLWK